MNIAYPRPIAAALALAVATPVLAQPAPTAPAGAAGWAGHPGGPYAALSPEGRQTLKAAHQAVDGDGTREQIEAARAQILTLLDADPLDVHALGKAMVTERNLSQGQQLRMQMAMLAAYRKLGPADRHAFVAASREVQVRIEQRRAARHGHPGPQGARGR